MIVRRGAVAVLLALAIISSPAAADTIPHERFDQAELDLAVLMLLLNESLRLSTESVLSCVADDSASALQYSDMLGTSLAAPSEIVQELSEDIESYEFLVTFIPPFQNLSADDSVLTADYNGFLTNLTELREIASDDPMPVDLYDRALYLMSVVNNYISLLYHDLDTLEADAGDIDALPEIPEQGELDSAPLVEAIRLLRDKLTTVEMELEAIALRVLDPTPRLVLTVNRGTLYLGDTLILSGYLFYHGGFVPHTVITVTKDGDIYTVVDTGDSGRFAREFWIPVNASYLGLYVFQAHAEFDSETLYSDEVNVTVLKVPTRISFAPLPSYELGKTILVNGTLTDLRGSPMPEQDLTVTLDVIEYMFETDGSGMFTATIVTAGLEHGAHTVSAAYDGNSTHSSSVSGPYTITLKFPAVLTLELSLSSLKAGETLVAAGAFSNLTGEHIANASVRVVIDYQLYGVAVTNSTGMFNLTIDTDDLGTGTHAVFAEHNGTGTVWFYTRSPERTFTVLTENDQGYFPGVIGGSEDVVDRIRKLLEDVFLGEYAILAWAILIVLLALAYLAYRRLRAKSEKRRQQEKELMRSLVYEPTIVRSTVRPLAAAGPISRMLSETTLWKLIDSLLGSMPPREAIVHGYGRFLGFLKAERDISIEPSLTHVEIQGELVFMGYPKDNMSRITDIYERAMYTAKEVSIQDALGFADALAVLETFGKEAPT